MKNFKCLFILFFLLIFPFNCFASDKYFERSKDNLKVPNDIIVSESNIDAIIRTPSVDETEKIYDFAHVLSNKEEKEIYESIMDFSNKSRLDAVIILTNDLNGFSIADYTYNFYDYNFFSVEGIIFTIYINGDNAEIFMANTGDLESDIFKIYNDKRINSILEYEYNHYINEKNYYDACINYMKIVDGFYSKATGNYKVDDKGNLVKDIPWIEIIIVSFAVSFITIIILLSKFSKTFSRVDDSFRKSVNYSTMLVKCEVDEVKEKNKIK